MELKINNDECWNKLVAGEKLIPENWSVRCLNSIRKEKTEIEKRYGIRISQTEIYCAICEKPWPGCTHSLPVKQEYNHPGRNLDDYQKELGIHFGMSKEEAFEKFRMWREKMKTCQRCECEKYIQFCPIHLICMEADDVRNVERNDNRGRTFKIDEPEGFRIGISETRKRASLR